MNIILLLYFIHKYKITPIQCLIYIILSIVIACNFSNIEYYYVSYLLYSSYVDYNKYIIPDTTHIISIIYILLTLSSITINNIIGSLIITIPFLIIHYIRNGIGFGDIKLVFFNGFILGIYNSIYMLNISIILILLNILISKLFKYNLDNKIAFGPYLMLSISIIIYIT